MEQHRANPSCASCHNRMDPLGFGLENFDAIGAWRTHDGGRAIDASGRLPAGREFRGPEGLRDVLRTCRATRGQARPAVVVFDLDGTLLDNRPRTVAILRDRYLATHRNGTIEANSLDTCNLHLGHFCRVLGEGFPLGELSLAKLQDYVNCRAKDRISPATVRKEIATLRAAWNRSR